MPSLQDLLDRVSSYQPSADLELIRRAYAFAETAHAGQFRKSGDPYVVHPLSVAHVISELRLDADSICAGLLHDCVEDTSATVDDITKLFGANVAFLVEGVTKLGKVQWHTKEEAQAENFRKMLVAMARDIRVILIKLCDRLDNMRTLGAMSPEKQERIARETMEIYAPLANRLGIQWVKTELEDLSFRYMYPREFGELDEKLRTFFTGRQQYIDEVVTILQKELDQNEIPARVTGRPKHMWSIYQKTVKTGRDLDQLFDIIAFRVLVKSVRNALIGFVVLGFALYWASRGEADQVAPGGRARAAFVWAKFPKFVLGFLAVSAVATLGWLSKGQLTNLANVSRWAFLLTFAGVGLNTDVRAIARAGWRPLVVAVIGLVVVAMVSLGLVLFTSRVLGWSIS